MNRPGSPLRIAAAAAALVAALTSGCAAVTNPVADGIPVRRLPPEAFGESKADLSAVSLAALTPPAPPAHLIGPGDTLGVFIEGVLGERGGQPPVRIPEQGSAPPGIGFPIPIREDGTAPLPLIDPLKLEGLTLPQAQDRVREAYLKPKKLLADSDKARIIVTLLRPRQYHVLVLREDAGGTTFGSAGGLGGFGSTGATFSQTRRAAGYPLDLPAYENNLLNALTRSGGLPGAEAQDEVLILRGAYQPAAGGQVPDALPAGTEKALTIRVPLRLRPGEPLNVRPEDLVLQNGDIVQVKARSGELFYTGGLLPPRAFPLPADRDLDVIEAVILVGGPLINGGLNTNNLSGQIVQTGLGFPSPSQVTILRRLKSGAQIPIIVSLNRAMKDPRERIALRAGDVMLLQSTVGEAGAQYLTSNFRFNSAYQAIRSRFFNSVGTVTLP
ncbi:polysaccharide biosynthesis/export family protein [Gemmata sp. JC717]|uniref:polysaccharide biosynthesis/export family protein n=1 Tax=Gemmata algarum TaxID=2975278 RepID=UPI0021BB6930|nr:polysaccharide biosynthesis/export family protein [Gemmata algarum]MDY3552159.1 polysaccharide biosynthesis/export family protein [Gemmata algarum]